MSVPERHIEFCRRVARLCREQGLRKYTATYGPPLDDGWPGDIQMVWEQGRHGEDSDKLFVQSNIRVWTKVGSAP